MPTDPGSMAAAVDAAAAWIAAFGRELATGLTDPAERLSLHYWPGAIALAVAALAGRTRLRDALRRGLRLCLHPSSRCDAKIALANGALAFAAGGLGLVGSLDVAVWTVRILDAAFGIPAAPDWPAVLVALVYSVVLFVAWDASRFLLHLAMHRVPALWAFHAVHHSAEVLTPLTLHRIHPVERMLYALRDAVVTGLCAGVFFHAFRQGISPVTIAGIHAAAFAMNAAGANLRHSHVFVGFGPFEGIFLSPAAHQLHHARRYGARAVNLGTWLCLWDRLAGTHVRPHGRTPPAFGLRRADAGHDPHGLLSAYFAPILRAVAALVPARLRRRVAAVVGVVVALVPPGVRAAPAGEEDARSYGGPSAVPAAPRSAAQGTPQHQETPERNARHGGPRRGPPHRTGSAAAAPPPLRPPAAPRERHAPPAAKDHDSTREDDGDEDDEDGGRRRIVVGSMFEGDPRGRIAGSAHVVDERQLERNEYDDVHRILSDVPGVYVRGEEGFGLRPNIGLRGANPDRSAKVALMEDGILLAPAPYAAPAAYYFPMPTRMVAVEVAKGPSSIRFGPNTVGGAVNLRTRPIPGFPVAVVDLAGGRFGYGKVHAYAGTSVKGFGVLAEVVRLQSDGFKHLDGGGETGFGRSEAMLKLGYQARGRRGTEHRVEVKGAYTQSREHETYLGLAPEDFERDPYRRYAASARDLFTLWRSLAELSYAMSTDGGLSFAARLYRHDFHRRWNKFDGFRDGPDVHRILAAPDAGQNQVFMAILRGEEDTAGPEQALLLGDNDRTFFAQGIDLSAAWKSHFRIVAQELSFGARLHHDGVDRDETTRAYWMTSGVLVPEGTPDQPKDRNRGRALAGAFFVYDVLTLWDRWTLAPGLRVEIIDTTFTDLLAGDKTDRLDTVVLPGIGTHVYATRWLGIFAGVHRGFSPVAPGQPKSVRPEDSVNYELGLRVTHDVVQAEIAGFASDYRNLNAACTLSAGCEGGQVGNQFSAGRALVAGVESTVRAGHTFRRGLRLFASASYTFTHARFLSSFVSGFPQWGTVEAGDELPYVPAHLVSLQAGTGGRIWEVSATGRYQSVMRDVAGKGPIPDAERIDGFFLLDLAAELRALERLRFYGLLQNATANRYVASLRPMGARPGAPLTFIVGVKIRALP